MDATLVVVRPFADCAPGDLIDNPGRVAAVLGSEHAYHVVRIVRPSLPASPCCEV